MEISVSLLISFIALAVSIITPGLNTILQNRHELKMYKIRTVEQHRQEVVEAYIRSAGTVIIHATSEAADYFGKNCGVIFAYIPKDLWPDAQKLNSLLLNKQWSQAQKPFEDFCLKISEHYPGLKD